MRYITKVEEISTAKKGDIIVKNSEAWMYLNAPKKHITGSDAGETYGEDHFVPDMTDRCREQTVSQKLHAEAGTESQRNDLLSEFLNSLKGEYVDNNMFRDPEDGEHTGRIIGHEEKMGYDGPFFTFEMEDADTKRRWTWKVSMREMGSIKIAEISRNNRDCFEDKEKNIDKEKAMKKILAGMKFRVFTIKRTEDGKILTYTDVKNYEKYIYWKSTQIHREEEHIQRTLERKAVEKYIEKTCEKMPWDE